MRGIEIDKDWLLAAMQSSSGQYFGGYFMKFNIR